ncbi:aldo/keto reductase [Kamptonema sp. UHCC 0994]|uniref:aldo/keto reductase n=1 Tax=Kamptonema sp. UHCC 0994 TaxID=3031329 RepID=UPI0023B93B9E|nr:aldo/keto reductase [Kamptonema sp. UHCC 0994]MDF0552700.1 aldo/keto reductase [Kamptonema sp. UHCC 0994]
MSAIAGRATAEGTQRYKERHNQNCAADHFREANSLVASSIGIGTYLGESDELTDTLVTAAVIESVQQGTNVIDSAINYRYQQGERSVGKAIRQLVTSTDVSRDELIICTKGGVLPYPNTNQSEWFYRHYVEPNNSSISMDDLAEERYCIHPEYIQDQLNRSLANLDIKTIDVYYIHNPEKQLSQVEPDVFYNQLRKVFEVLEDAILVGKIANYGLATWNAFRVPPNQSDHIDLSRAKSIAREVAGNKEDRFRFIQFPLNMAMPEALLYPTQMLGGEQISTLEAADRLGIAAIASKSICQAQVAGKIPENIASVFGDRLGTDCQRALQYTRSAPGLLSALVGMKTPKHIRENLAITAIPQLERANFHKLTELIAQVLNLPFPNS